MNTCSEASASVNGFTMTLVTKQNISPKKIEIGSAGRAFRKMANRSRVRQRPYDKHKTL